MSEPKYKLVPVDPTQAMIDRGTECCPGRGVKSLWIEMMAAAPSPPQDPRDEALRVAREALKCLTREVDALMGQYGPEEIKEHPMIRTMDKANSKALKALHKIKELMGEK